MKLLFTSALVLLLTISVNAQSFEVLSSDGANQGVVGQQITAEVPIKNISDKPIYILIERLDKVIGTSQEAYLCWGDDCQDPGVDQLPLSKRINPGETITQFKSILETGLVPGISTVKYRIYNRDNPSESVDFEVNYTVEERVDSRSLYSSKDIVINEIYPNPVVEFAILNYNLINPDVEAKLVLHNLLGSIVGEFTLNPYEKKLKILTEDYNPGVYFYTLYLDGDGVTTHKLVIRK